MNVPTGNESTDRVQANLVAYHRLFADLPGVSFVDEDIVFVTSRGPLGNLVLRTDFSDDGIEQRMDAALNRIGRSAGSIDWFVFPSCRPSDLGDRLVQHAETAGPDSSWNLVGNKGGPGGIWMLADLTSLPSSPSVSPIFQVKRVSDPAQLKEWERINAQGFGSDDSQVLYDAFARHGLGRHASALHYVGYMNDEPVTSATLFLAGGIASIYNVSTPTALRRQGFGSAITYAALKYAPRRGYRTAFIWSSRLGRGVYSNLGFDITDFGVREYQWQKR